jgi:hypothetical protein
MLAMIKILPGLPLSLNALAVYLIVLYTPTVFTLNILSKSAAG